MRKLLKCISILLVILWMIIVFSFSAESSGESEYTSDSFTKFIFKGNITDDNVEKLSFIIRKIAHFTLYALGGICICICALLNFKANKRVYFISYIIGTAYAITDEIHQLFISGRSCELRDVIIDSSGIFVGVMLIKSFKYFFYKIKRS